MEDVEVRQGLAVGREQNGLADHAGDRERRATARIAVELGEHHSVETDALVEGLRGVDGVLADHGVNDEQHLVGAGDCFDVGGLLHQHLIDAQPASCVDHHHVVETALRVFDGPLGNLHRIAHAVAGLGCEDMDPGPLPHDLQLVDRVGALQVTGDQQRTVLLGLQPARQLPCEGGLSSTLKTGEHDDGRRFLGEPDGAGLPTQDLDELLIDDLDDLLRGIERPADLDADAAFLDCRDELLDHPEVDVCLQQRDADLTHRGVDIRRGEAPFGPEALEHICEAVLKCVEQVRVSLESEAMRAKNTGEGQ